MTAALVRLALPIEAEAIAALQRRAWQNTLPPELAADALESVELDAMTDAWRAAILRPPLATLRVLVAVGGDATGTARVAGFAAVGPSDDQDAEPGRDGLVAEFAIDPVARRLGHGSRLVQACVDTMRADGFIRATWWVRSTDDVLRRFLTDAGWAADGAHAELGTQEGPARVRLVRLHTDISA